MRALALLAPLALLLAGCTGAPPGGNNTTGDGSNLYGNDTTGGRGFGNTTGPGLVIPPGTGNALAWHNASNPIVVWTTSMGTFKAELFVDAAPITAGNFVNLTRSGFYDGTRFHRVIAGFMIQDGDPLSKDTAQKARWGTGGSDTDIPDEFPCKDGTWSYEHLRARNRMPCANNGGLLFTHDGPGLLSMANAGPNTGSSQYFITVAKTSSLDGQHAIFGRVVEGYDIVESISRVPTNGNPPQGQNRPLQDVVNTDLAVEGS